MGALAVIVLLVACPGVFRNLPAATLAAVVIIAATTLVEITGLVRLAGSATQRAGAVAGRLPRRGPARRAAGASGWRSALSLLNFVRKSWRPHTAELVRVDGLKGYHDAERHPEGRSVPGLLLYRFDAPLFFANAEEFRSDLLEAGRQRPIRRSGGSWWRRSRSPTSTPPAPRSSRSCSTTWTRRGVELAFAELKGTVRDRLVPYGLVDRLGPEHFYRTIGQAVKDYVADTGVAWTDWEDEPPAQP